MPVSNTDSVAPAFGSLTITYKKISFGFVIVPTVIIGTIYSHVACKYVYNRLMGNTRRTSSLFWILDSPPHVWPLS
jgi:hypothetical protein